MRRHRVQAQGVHMRIAVGIPTFGRAAMLAEALRELQRQSRSADQVIVCGGRPADVEGATDALPAVTTLLAGPGLPQQRNAVIGAAAGADIVVFFDDDFLPHPDYVAAVGHAMARDPRIVIATGKVLADGILGPGISPEAARAILGRAKPTAPTIGDVERTFTGYGCNMAVRLATLRTTGVRFDERLPLYAWQEDVDFSRRLAAFGEIVRVSAAQGVHLGVKLGRSPGLRLGYSQVANPLYIAGKRSGYPLREAVSRVGRNVAMNTLRSTCPEPEVDRRGRLRGNVLAFVTSSPAGCCPSASSSFEPTAAGGAPAGLPSRCATRANTPPRPRTSAP